VKVDGDAWTWLCGSGMANSLAGAVSHESHPPRLLVGASVVEACWLCGGGRDSPAWWWESVAASELATARRQREEVAQRRP
jgi:hypothetical protein